MCGTLYKLWADYKVENIVLALRKLTVCFSGLVLTWRKVRLPRTLGASVSTFFKLNSHSCRRRCCLWGRHSCRKTSKKCTYIILEKILKCCKENSWLYTFQKELRDSSRPLTLIILTDTYLFYSCLKYRCLEMDNINIFLSLPDSLYNRYLPFCCLILLQISKMEGLYSFLT